MKELSIEEKAKAYDEAIERARKINRKPIKLNPNITICEYLFPELAESEDEKMREELIRSFKSLNTIEIWNGIKRSDIIAWLEKQGQKSAWTEADDEKLENTINALKGAGKHGSFDWLSTATWLLTIKQRIGG